MGLNGNVMNVMEQELKHYFFDWVQLCNKHKGNVLHVMELEIKLTQKIDVKNVQEEKFFDKIKYLMLTFHMEVKMEKLLNFLEKEIKQ
jgi:hypothetical protein